uniref:Uncharacterized protein n=1 Tax=Haptolina brevifila TaxID=156173 RepID=A0A7S2NN36_9EUKA
MAPLRAGGPRLVKDLFLRIEPSLPRHFRLEPPDPNQVKLDEEALLRLTFLGGNDKEVQLTKPVLKEQKKILEAVITAQNELKSFHMQPNDPDMPLMIVSEDPHFKIDGNISAKKKELQQSGLGFVFKLKVLCEEEYYTTQPEGGAPDNLSRTPIPKATFWSETGELSRSSNDRTKARAIPLELFLMGCTIVKLGEQTYVEFEHNIFMRKASDEKGQRWERYDGPLPPGERLTYLDGKSVTKKFKMQVLSGGNVRMVLQGPLVELLSENAELALANSEHSIENHSTFPMLKVCMIDDYGAFAPGAPGDMIRLQWDGNVHVLPLGPDGTATFEKLTLTVLAESLQSQAAGSQAGGSSTQIQRRPLAISIDAFNKGSASSSATSRGEGPAQGNDGSLIGIEKVVRYLTVVPSALPAKLVLSYNGQPVETVDVSTGGGSDASSAVQLATIAEMAGTQLSGLKLTATNEVGVTLAPPYEPTVTLTVDNQPLPTEDLDCFLRTGELPPMSQLRVPSAIRDGSRTVSLELRAASSRSRRQSSSSAAHHVELRLCLKPLPGPPVQWRILSAQPPRAAAGGTPSATTSAAANIHGRAGRGTPSAAASASSSSVGDLEVSVGDPIQTLLRIIAADANQNECTLDGTTAFPVLTVCPREEGNAPEADGDTVRSPCFRLDGHSYADAFSGDRSLNLQPEGDGSSTRGGGPADSSREGANGGIGSLGEALRATVGDRSLQRSATRGRQGTASEASVDAVVGFIAKGARLHGPCGTYTLIVSDPDGNFKAATAVLTLLPGAPSTLSLRPSALTALRAECHTGTRLCISQHHFRMHVLDASANPLVVERFEWEPPQVVRIEPSSADTPLVRVARCGELTTEDQGREHVVDKLLLRFDPQTSLGSVRPLKQSQRLTFRAKVKHGGKSSTVSSGAIIVEARLATSRVVKELVLVDAAACLAGSAPPAPLPPPDPLPKLIEAGWRLPTVGVGFELENGERCTLASLMGEATEIGTEPMDTGAPATSSSTAPSSASPIGAMRPRRATRSMPDGSEDASTLQPSLPVPASPATITLVRAGQGGRTGQTLTLDHLGDGRFALKDDNEGITKVGDYEVRAEYTETREIVREALAGSEVDGFADETKLEARTLLMFSVIAGPPALIAHKTTNVVACNNTSRLNALAPSKFTMLDTYGNPTMAPAGAKVRLIATCLRTTGETAARNAAAFKAAAAAAAGGASSSTAAAAAAAAAASSSAAAAASGSHLDPSAGSQTVAVPPALCLPDGAGFDSNGVAHMEGVKVANREGDDCTIVFSFLLDGWSGGSVPVLPDPISVEFENTAVQEEEHRRESEQRAEQSALLAALQNEHSVDVGLLANSHMQKQQIQIDWERNRDKALSLIQSVTNLQLPAAAQSQTKDQTPGLLHQSVPSLWSSTALKVPRLLHAVPAQRFSQ